MVAGASPLPSLRTAAESVKEDPAVGRLLLTEGAATTRSGLVSAGRSTVTVADAEQLLEVSDSPATASTHEP